jgi:hypothetical protein
MNWMTLRSVEFPNARISRVHNPTDLQRAIQTTGRLQVISPNARRSVRIQSQLNFHIRQQIPIAIAADGRRMTSTKS